MSTALPSSLLRYGPVSPLRLPTAQVRLVGITYSPRITRSIFLISGDYPPFEAACAFIEARNGNVQIRFRGLMIMSLRGLRTSTPLILRRNRRIIALDNFSEYIREGITFHFSTFNILVKLSHRE